MALLGMALFLLVMGAGGAEIPWSDVWTALTHSESSKPSWVYIVREVRLPLAMAAMLSGAALSVAGLMMQTVFRNPLAGPSLLGVSSGASLGVAILSMALGGALGITSIIAAAVIGAMAVIALLAGFSSIVRNGLTMLIVGVMLSYLSSAIISLLNFLAPAADVKQFAVWGMGNFTAITADQIPIMTCITLSLLVLSALTTRPLNALLLGERYAASMGYSVKTVRTILLVLSGTLTAVVTAYCGPIGFIGLIVPHLARMMFNTSAHGRLLPASILMGSVISLFCAYLAIELPSAGVLPVNTITPALGVPIIFYLLLAGRRLSKL